MNRSKTVRLLSFLSVTLLMLTLSTTPALAEDLSESEEGRDAIAKFLLNFGRFIDWPATAFASDAADFSVCVLGQNSLGSSLQSTLRGKKASDRNFSVTELSGTQLDQAASCHIVYVSPSENSRVGEIASALAGKPVLTVSDVDAFPESGGMIGLSSTDGDKVAIRMHSTLIAEAGLEVREQLMRAIQ